MPANDVFTQLMRRLRGGEDGAAREVFERFARRLLALARSRFRKGLEGKVDAEDVVQSAYKSFFLRHRAGKVEVRDWNGLWGLLSRIALRKCADRVEYFRAGCRDVAREAAGPPPPDPGGWELEGREPTPLEAAILAETIENLLKDWEDDERPVVELSLQGYTAQEISLRLGRAERSVRRLRERVKKRLERLQLQDAAGI